MDGRLTRPGRFGVLMVLTQFGWALPSAASGTLLQALAAQIDPAGKVAFYGTLATVGAVCATISMVVSGALSDRTRTRFGERKPWILGGAVVSAVALSLIGTATAPAVIVICYAVYQAGQAAMVGAILGLLSDRLTPSVLGRVSGLGGLGYLAGLTIGTLLAAVFLPIPTAGLAVVPWTMVVAALAMVLATPTVSSPRESPPSWGVRALLPPPDIDFWLTFVGRFLFILSFQTVLAYNLYILTDYLHLPTSQTGRLFSLAVAVFALGAGVCAVLAGTWSDRLLRRKPFLLGACGLVAVAALPGTVVAQSWSYLAFFVLAGIGFGIYLAVDQALMVQVLPSRHNAARDLAVLNAANSLPQVLAPGAAALLVSLLGYPAIFAAGTVAATLALACVLGIRRVR